MEQSSMGHRHISWKHICENYCLSCHNNKLLDDNDALQHFGVRNNSQVQFCLLCHDKRISEALEEEKAPFFSWP
ncbi:hypothetical protein JHK82_032639 [Glycine max]|nr:hypothetical protein JHK87_032573 [Glycine soja]KAG4966925.1 hypothetical protein JHK87_032576 [Glycine soja]KAG4985039.1 hypothetical protein JHK86_032730 [Glycine max]KAG5118219.1 hypothetical protein JHK82_032639 [Glycine max]KHN05435.1 hypothetical protein glysoja_020400 [Glycine soja]